MDKTEYFDSLERIIEAVEECGGTNVTIAGGAVRDVVLDKPIADIDVWYETPLDITKVIKLFKVQGGSTGDDYVQGEDDYFNVEFAKVNFEGCKYPIQLIYTTDVKKRVEGFPANISKASFDKNGMHLSLEFLFAMTEKIIQFDSDVSDKYKDKIIAKYSDYSYV